jgi:hypothetical protein
MVHERWIGGDATLGDLWRWERTLASKEARYLRAVETLVPVRRLWEAFVRPKDQVGVMK